MPTVFKALFCCDYITSWDVTNIPIFPNICLHWGWENRMIVLVLAKWALGIRIKTIDHVPQRYTKRESTMAFLGCPWHNAVKNHVPKLQWSHRRSYIFSDTPRGRQTITWTNVDQFPWRQVKSTWFVWSTGIYPDNNAVVYMTHFPP